MFTHNSPLFNKDASIICTTFMVFNIDFIINPKQMNIYTININYNYIDNINLKETSLKFSLKGIIP